MKRQAKGRNRKYRDGPAYRANLDKKKAERKANESLRVQLYGGLQPHSYGYSGNEPNDAILLQPPSMYGSGYGNPPASNRTRNYHADMPHHHQSALSSNPGPNFGGDQQFAATVLPQYSYDGFGTPSRLTLQGGMQHTQRTQLPPSPV